jgi:uncharacterized lipoprotein
MSRDALWRLVGGLGLAAVLSACGPFPDARNQANSPARQAERARAAEPPRPPGRLADPAETACLNAAVAAGHAVLGLDPPTRPPGSAGIGVRVRAAGSDRTLACRYDPVSGQARLVA